jgi:hypothetical protein
MVETHHAYLRQELPRIGVYLAKLAAVRSPTERWPEPN